MTTAEGMDLDAKKQTAANGDASGAKHAPNVKQDKRQSLLLLKRKFAEISCMIEGTAHEARGLVAWKLAQPSAKSIKLSAEDRRQLDDGHKKRLAEITARQGLQAVKAAMAHKWAWPFNQPVDIEKYKDYLLVVSQPMDFGTIKTKCEAGQYQTPEQLLSDARLVFDNARKYNPPGTDVFVMAQTVQDKFLERWQAQVEPKIKEEHKYLAAAEAALKRQLGAALMEKQSQAMDPHVHKVLGALQDIQNLIMEAKSMAAMLCSPLSSAEVEALATRLRRLNAAQLEPIISLLEHHSPGLSMEKSDFDLDLHSYDALLLRQLDYYATACDSAGLLEPAEAGAEAGAEEVTRTIPWGPATLDGAARCPVKFPNLAIGAGLKARSRADLQLEDPEPDPTDLKPASEPSLRPILSQASAAIKAAGSPVAPGSPLLDMPTAVVPTGIGAAAAQATRPTPPVSIIPPSLSAIITQSSLPPSAGANGTAGTAALGGINPDSPYHSQKKAPTGEPSATPPPVLVAASPVPVPHVPPPSTVDWSVMLPRTTPRLTATTSSTPLPYSTFSEPAPALNPAHLHATNAAPTVGATFAQLSHTSSLPQPSLPTPSGTIPVPVPPPFTSSTGTITATAIQSPMISAPLIPSTIPAHLQPTPLRNPSIADRSWATTTVSSPHPTIPMTTTMTHQGTFVPLHVPPSSSGTMMGNAAGPNPISSTSPAAVPQAVHAMLNPATLPGLRASSSDLAAFAVGLNAAASTGTAGLNVAPNTGIAALTAGVSTAAGGHDAAVRSGGIPTVLEVAGRTTSPGTAIVTTAGTSRFQESSSAVDNDPTLLTSAQQGQSTSTPSIIPTSLSLSSTVPSPIPPPSTSLSLPTASQPPPSLPTTISTITGITTTATPAVLPSSASPSAPALTAPLGIITPSPVKGNLVAKATAMAQASRGVRGPGFTVPAVNAVLGSTSTPTRALHLGQAAFGSASPLINVSTPSAIAAASAGAATAVPTATVLPAAAMAGSMLTVSQGRDAAGGAQGTEGAVVLLSTSQPATNKAAISQHMPGSIVPVIARQSGTDQIAASSQFPLLTTPAGQHISVLNLSGPLSPAAPTAGKPSTAHILPIFTSQLPVTSSAGQASDPSQPGLATHPPPHLAQQPLPAAATSQPVTVLHPQSTVVPMIPLNAPTPSSISQPLTTAPAAASLARPADSAHPQALTQSASMPAPQPTTISVLNLQQAASPSPQLPTSQPAAVTVTNSAASSVLPVWHSTAQLPSGITVAVLPAAGGATQTALVAPSQAQAATSQALPATLQLLGHAGGRPIQIMPVQSLSPQQHRLQQLNLQALSQHLIQQVGGHQVIAVHRMPPGQPGAGTGTGQAVLQLASGTAMLQLPTILPATSHLLQAQKPTSAVQTVTVPQQLSVSTAQIPKQVLTSMPTTIQASLPASSAVLVSTSIPPLGSSVVTAAGPISAGLVRPPASKMDAEKIVDSSHIVPKVPLGGASALTPGIITSSSTTAALAPTSLQYTGSTSKPPTIILTPSTNPPPSSVPGMLGPMSSIATLASSTLAGSSLPLSLAASAKGVMSSLPAAILPGSGAVSAAPPTATVITPASSLPDNARLATVIAASSTSPSTIAGVAAPASSTPAAAIIGTATFSMPVSLPVSASMIGSVGMGPADGMAGIMSAVSSAGEPTAGIVSGANLGAAMSAAGTTSGAAASATAPSNNLTPGGATVSSICAYMPHISSVTAGAGTPEAGSAAGNQESGAAAGKQESGDAAGDGALTASGAIVGKSTMIASMTNEAGGAGTAPTGSAAVHTGTVSSTHPGTNINTTSAINEGGDLESAPPGSVGIDAGIVSAAHGTCLGDASTINGPGRGDAVPPGNTGTGNSIGSAGAVEVVPAAGTVANGVDETADGGGCGDTIVSGDSLHMAVEGDSGVLLGTLPVASHATAEQSMEVEVIPEQSEQASLPPASRQ